MIQAPTPRKSNPSASATTIFDKIMVVHDSVRISGSDFDEQWRTIFTDSHIRRALGGPLSASPHHEWFFARRTDDGRIVACASIDDDGHLGRGRLRLDNAYVDPDHRALGLYQSLLDLRIAYAHEATHWRYPPLFLRAIALPPSFRALESRGFTMMGRRGHMRIYERGIWYGGV